MLELSSHYRIKYIMSSHLSYIFVKQYELLICSN